MRSAAATVVTVRFFASLREAVGRDSLDLAILDPCLSGLREGLGDLLEEGALRAISARGVQVCVNHDIVRGDVRLRTGDEVAFLPPVTGG